MNNARCMQLRPDWCFCRATPNTPTAALAAEDGLGPAPAPSPPPPAAAAAAAAGLSAIASIF